MKLLFWLIGKSSHSILHIKSYLINHHPYRLHFIHYKGGHNLIEVCKSSHQEPPCHRGPQSSRRGLGPRWPRCSKWTGPVIILLLKQPLNLVKSSARNETSIHNARENTSTQSSNLVQFNADCFLVGTQSARVHQVIFNYHLLKSSAKAIHQVIL